MPNTKDHWQRFFEISKDRLCVLKADGTFVDLNPAFVNLLGFGRDVLIDSSLLMLVKHDEKEKTEEALRVLKEGQKTIAFVNRCRNKLDQYLQLKWSFIKDTDTGYIFALVKKIKSSDVEITSLQKKEEMVNALGKIFDLLVRRTDVTRLYNEMLHVFLQLTNSGYGMIGCLTQPKEGDPFITICALGGYSKESKQWAPYISRDLEVMEIRNLDTFLGRAVKEAKVLFSNHPSLEMKESDLLIGFPELEALLVIPILDQNNVIGVCALANRLGGYDELVVHYLQPLSQLLKSILQLYADSSHLQATPLAHFDQLTGLYSRNFFEENLKQQIEDYPDKKFILVYIDLSRFKDINDIYGNIIGDHILEVVAERLREALNEKDIIARIGGDEFAIMVTRVLDIKDIFITVDRIKKILEQHYDTDQSRIHLSVNIGVARFPEAGPDMKNLQKNVDFALNEARTKKTKIEYFSKVMEESYNERLLIETSLEKAFAENEFYLLYQPQVNILTGKIIGLEALLRWKHPQLGMVLPSKFVPIIESSGRADRLNIWVVENLLKGIQLISKAVPDDLVYSFNFSPAVLGLTRHVEYLLSLLSGYIGRYSLQIEITEQNMMDKKFSMKVFTTLLTKANISLSIDDFGRSFSSLGRLVDLPIKTIKIDSQFITDMVEDDKTFKVVCSIINLAFSLGIKVVAEGVETELQVAILKKNGCEVAQGWFYYPPLTIAEVKAAFQ